MPRPDHPDYKEYMRKYMAQRHARQRARGIEYLGVKCVDCGTTDRLEFDHKDPPEKEFTISSKFTRGWARLVEELDKCDLRCVPCHRRRTAAQRAVPHGGGVSGKKNCYCELCKPVKQEYNRRYRKNRGGTVVANGTNS